MRPRQPARYSLDALLQVDATTVRTRSPFHRSDVRQQFDFRGTLVRTLLDRVQSHDPNADVTFLAFDGYFVSVRADALRAYEVLLAQFRDGEPLTRRDGGPLLVVFPYSTHPEIAERFPEMYWCFYVAEMIVGDTPAALHVGTRTFDLAALDALPTARVEGPVRFRQRWPSGAVRLAGVRVRDVLAAAGVDPGRAGVRITTRVPVDRDPSHEHRVTADQLANTDVMLATRWGDANEPIPTRMGGPIALVVPVPPGAPEDSVRWATFVDGVEVLRP